MLYVTSWPAKPQLKEDPTLFQPQQEEGGEVARPYQDVFLLS